MGLISNVKTAVKAGKKAYDASKVASVKKAADAAAAAKKAKDAADSAKKLAKADKIIARSKKVKKTAAVAAVSGGAGAYGYKKVTEKGMSGASKGTAAKVAGKAIAKATTEKLTPSWMKNATSNKKKFGGPVNVQPGKPGKIRSSEDQGYTAIGKREPSRTSFKKGK